MSMRMPILHCRTSRAVGVKGLILSKAQSTLALFEKRGPGTRAHVEGDVLHVSLELVFVAVILRQKAR